ncbi:MAG TPA: OmpA family protein, partial [Arenibacter sp.]|nr:OmpA family protein [Arenibacter sp.]
QLRVINDALSARDSTTLALFTLFKQHLGPDAKITLSNGAIAVVMDNGFLFGSNPQNATIAANADVILGKIGNILKARQELDIEIIANSNLVDAKDNKKNNWQIATQQAAAVATAMEKKYQIEAKRIRTTGISELGLYSIETATEIIVQPKYFEFYKMVKEAMK